MSLAYIHTPTVLARRGGTGRQAGLASRHQKGDGAAGWETKQQEGIAQVQGYLQLPTIATLPKLSAWLMLTDSERVEIQRVKRD